MPVREPLESCENSSSVNSGCINGSVFEANRESVGSSSPSVFRAMAKDEGYEESMDDLALTMKNNLKLKTAPSSSYFNKKHRLSPYSMQENQNRCKSSCVSLEGNHFNQCPSTGSDPGQTFDQEVNDVGTCRLLREGSLIKEAVKRLQSKRRPFPF